MATAVVSGRVNEKVRQRADVVIRKAGLSPTEIIQNVWHAIAESGEIPSVALPVSPGKNESSPLNRYEQFLASLPPKNPAYEDWSDEDILALRIQDNA